MAKRAWITEIELEYRNGQPRLWFHRYHFRDNVVTRRSRFTTMRRIILVASILKGVLRRRKHLVNITHRGWIVSSYNGTGFK